MQILFIKEPLSHLKYAKHNSGKSKGMNKIVNDT